MSILIGLLPALGWGILPLLVRKIGGNPSNQILGTTAGTLLIAVIVTVVYPSHDTNPTVFILSLLSGALWVVGQIGQYTAFQTLGVSRTMPLSTGLQLVGTALIGVFIFSEWPSLNAKLIGFAALAMVIIGIYLTTLKKGGEDGGVNKQALLLLFLTTFGYLAYSSIPRVLGTAGMSIFLPQAIGMLLASVAYALITHQGAVFKEKTTWLNMIPGFAFAFASLAYIISAQTNGLATGFVLAQLSVVIATIGGIVLLKERKSRFELVAICIGLTLVVAGSAITAMLR